MYSVIFSTVNTNTLLPWLREDWSRLAQRQLAGRLPHAMLLTGKSGVGKSSFSIFAAQSFLCENPTTSGYCGECNSCKLFSAGTHPDFLPVMPAEGKALIAVDQVRGFIAEMELTPQCSAHKVAVIDPAECMNGSSANALLKTLEEPASTHLILLVSTTPGFLPATIRSRCQRVNLTVDSSDTALKWLREHPVDQAERLLSLHPDSPLRALGMADGTEITFQQGLYEDVLRLIGGKLPVNQAAAKYKEAESRHVLSILMKWFSDSIKFHMDCADESTNNPACGHISALANKLNINKIFNIYNEMQHFYAIDSSSFKTQAVLEGLFADMRLNHLN